MKKEREVKRAITHRMHLTSLEDVVDEALKRLPRRLLDCGDEDVREMFRQWLLSLARHLARFLAQDFQSAAKRGIEEAANLVDDPDYYETVKRRRSRDRAREDAWRKQQEEARARHERGEYTLKERTQMIGRAAYDVQYHERELEKARTHLSELQQNGGVPPPKKNKVNKSEGGDGLSVDWGDADW